MAPRKAKHFVVYFTGFAQWQFDRFEELLEQFFEEVMADGKSQASYTLQEVRANSEVIIQPPPRTGRKKEPQ